MRLVHSLALALATLAGAAHAAPVERARFLMGTTCTVAAEGPDAAGQIEAAFAEARRVESLLSTWTHASELARVNRGEEAPGPELRALLDTTLAFAARTGGAFDPRVADLVTAWDLRGEGALPDRRTIDAALAQRTAERPRFEEGGFGKGYALDRMMARVTSRSAVIDFGGQVIARGSVRVGLADPEDRGRPIAQFTLTGGSVSTSSGSEKTFEVRGRRFSHILDPRSGEAISPRGSASVIADDALSADILSTALYVMGEDDGLRWADANGVAALFVTIDHDIRLSARARERVRDLEVLDRNYELKE